MVILNWRRNLWALWFGCILSSSSYTMLVPFLPLYLFDLGVTSKTVNLWSGLIFSISFFVGAVMAPFWGRWADKAGKRRMVIRAGVSLGTVYFLGSLVRTPEELFLVRLLQGFAAGFVPAAMALVSSSAPEDKMGFSLGLMQTATLTGGIIGPLIGGTLAHLFGIRASFQLAAALIFLGTLAVRLLVTEPPCTEPPKCGGVVDDLKEAWQNQSLVKMLLLLLVVQISAMALQPLITLYVAELQGQLEGAMLSSGIVFGLAGIAGAIAAPLWGRLGQEKGFYKILLIGFIGAGVLNVSQFFAGNIFQFGALQFAYGLFIAGVFPAINTIVVNSTESCFRGRAFGLTMSANQLGGMIGPLAGGLASSWFGIKIVFVGTGVALLLVGAVLIFKGKQIEG
ncbi:MAG: MFS transporter [Negativicutes bacterium]|nr:MFS transporter [Negativicutes bacterium]